MLQIWKWIGISCLGGCLAAAVVASGNAMAQSDQSRDDDQQTSASQRESRDSDRESRDRGQARERSDRNDEPSRDRQDERRSSRDQYRHAPEMYDRGSSRDEQNEEQGGLGVSVVDDERGVRVTRVYGDTPAEEMGLRPGDRITHVDGHEVESARQFIGRIRDMDPGEEVELDIIRNQEERSISGELESRREAVLVQNQQGRQDRSFDDVQSRDRSDARDRLYALERQLDQLRRELQQLKASLEESSERDSRSGRESTVRYEERRQSNDSYPERQSRYDGSDRRWDRSAPARRAPSNVDRSPGGETGEERLHPGPHQLDE